MERQIKKGKIDKYCLVNNDKVMVCATLMVSVLDSDWPQLRDEAQHVG